MGLNGGRDEREREKETWCDIARNRVGSTTIPNTCHTNNDVGYGLSVERLKPRNPAIMADGLCQF